MFESHCQLQNNSVIFSRSYFFRLDGGSHPNEGMRCASLRSDASIRTRESRCAPRLVGPLRGPVDTPLRERYFFRRACRRKKYPILFAPAGANSARLGSSAPLGANIAGAARSRQRREHCCFLIMTSGDHLFGWSPVFCAKRRCTFLGVHRLRLVGGFQPALPLLALPLEA